MDEWTGDSTDRQVDSQTDRHTYGQTDKEAADRYKDRQTGT